MLALEGIDDVHCGDGLPLHVHGVGDSVGDHVIQEDLQDAKGFLVDQAGDPLDTTPPGQAPDGGLGDPLHEQKDTRDHKDVHDFSSRLFG